MNKIIVLFIGLSLVLGACRKGEDDPFLSLRTRDARLKGEWKLVEMKKKQTGEYEETFDGTTYTAKTNGVVTQQHSYQRTLTFEKGGLLNEELISNGQTYIANDYWLWAHSDKKKTNLILYTIVYVVKRLTNKEMVLVRDVKWTDSMGTVFYLEESLSFEKK